MLGILSLLDAVEGVDGTDSIDMLYESTRRESSFVPPESVVYHLAVACSTGRLLPSTLDNFTIIEE